MTKVPFLARIHRDRRGVSTTEFGILIGLFALASLQAISTIGSEVSDDFDHASTKVGAADMLGPLGGNAPATEPPVAGDQAAPTTPEMPLEPDPNENLGPIYEPPTAMSKMAEY